MPPLLDQDCESELDYENDTLSNEARPSFSVANPEPSTSETPSLDHSLEGPPRKKRKLSTPKRNGANTDEAIKNSGTTESKEPSFRLRIPEFMYPKSLYPIRQESAMPDTRESAVPDTKGSAVPDTKGSAMPTTQDSAVLEDIMGQEHAKPRSKVPRKRSVRVDLEGYSVYRIFESGKMNESREKKILPSEPASLDEITPKKAKEEKFFTGELASLHEMGRIRKREWRFDGIISYGDKKAYVQNVRIKALSIEGYEDKGLDTVGSSVCIQSVQGKKSKPAIWYQLKAPASQYKRYHDAFLWMADLAKHVNDYLHCHSEVSLEDFRSLFHEWLQDKHGASSDFQSWQTKFGDTDYRRAVAAHSSFLYHQASRVSKIYVTRSFWGEIGRMHLNAVPAQLSATSKTTVVTPFVYKCFEDMPWKNFLKEQQIAPAVLCTRKSQAAFEPLKPRGTFRKPESHSKRISVGDAVKAKTNDDSFGYVQHITETKNGQALDIIWLYRPSDTACQKMKYPYENELFLSDYCNCDRGNNHFYAKDAEKVKVDFYGSPENVGVQADFFVRHKYLGVEQSWVTLCESDFQCKCRRSKLSNLSQYEVGDTLLVAVSLPTSPISTSERILEPVELEKKIDGQDLVRVRRLQRRGRDYQQEDAEPNELVYTEILETIKAEDIIRRCHIRFFSEEDKQQRRIPDQYRRQGTADFYYIIYQAQSVMPGLTILPKPWPPSFRQGWDCATASAGPVMRGLDLFCGGGNFGRGLEEGGAVTFQWAVDYDNHAIHTYRANARDTKDVKLFNGSVNDYLVQACEGAENPLVASPGSVDVISAGSPCQGFSLANSNKENDKGLLDVSMVASVVAYVDLYRPKYALLENVTQMAPCSEKRQDQNVFAQVLCALVALGYQVRPFILDAWNFGSPQSRTRLFISIAAPGLIPLDNPPHSHSHPKKMKKLSLGWSANGSPIGKRRFEETPFECVTIGAATKDLPINFEGRIDCIPFPDHRPSRDMATINRLRISCIPRFPAGMTFVKATILGLPEGVTIDQASELGFPAGMTSDEAIRKGLPAETTFDEAGRMPAVLAKAWDWKSTTRSNPKTAKSWQRINPDALMATVTTVCQHEDINCGSWIHWDACRTMTVMEVRRAQGFPDREVIIGSTTRQWKVIGNSVARPVALALGMALRKAWLLNLENPAHSKEAIHRDTSDQFGPPIPDFIIGSTPARFDLEPSRGNSTAQTGLSHGGKQTITDPAARPSNHAASRKRTYDRLDGVRPDVGRLNEIWSRYFDPEIGKRRPAEPRRKTTIRDFNRLNEIWIQNFGPEI